MINPSSKYSLFLGLTLFTSACVPKSPDPLSLMPEDSKFIMSFSAAPLISLDVLSNAPSEFQEILGQLKECDIELNNDSRITMGASELQKNEEAFTLLFEHKGISDSKTITCLLEKSKIGEKTQLSTIDKKRALVGLSEKDKDGCFLIGKNTLACSTGNTMDGLSKRLDKKGTSVLDSNLAEHASHISPDSSAWLLISSDVLTKELKGTPVEKTTSILVHLDLEEDTKNMNVSFEMGMADAETSEKTYNDLKMLMDNIGAMGLPDFISNSLKHEQRDSYIFMSVVVPASEGKELLKEIAR